MRATLERTDVQRYHEEVVTALRAIGDPRYGRAVQKDRGSGLKHLGVRFPDLRRRVKAEFSFCSLPDEVVLETWDALWKGSPYGDVLFAALEYYAPRVRKDADPRLWPVVRTWTDRVDNWCHADLLSSVYSHICAQYPDDVLPQLRAWNRSDEQWLRRISLASLIHSSGKHAVFLPPDVVLPLVSTCLDDHRHYTQTAVGWVLREMGNVYTEEIGRFLESNAGRMGAPALTRAIERRTPTERARLRQLRAERPSGA